jgi:hypothetical protein
MIKIREKQKRQNAKYRYYIANNQFTYRANNKTQIFNLFAISEVLTKFILYYITLFKWLFWIQFTESLKKLAQK